jgi:hypothetical protein
MGYFNPEGVAEARSQIGGLKSRYSRVGDHVEEPYDEHLFGRSDSAKGVHHTTRRFSDHVRDQYQRAGHVLGDVERAMDDTERDYTTTERVNAEQFER